MYANVLNVLSKNKRKLEKNDQVLNFLYLFIRIIKLMFRIKGSIIANNSKLKGSQLAALYNFYKGFNTNGSFMQIRT